MEIRGYIKHPGKIPEQTVFHFGEKSIQEVLGTALRYFSVTTAKGTRLTVIAARDGHENGRYNCNIQGYSFSGPIAITGTDPDGGIGTLNAAPEEIMETWPDLYAYENASGTHVNEPIDRFYAYPTAKCGMPWVALITSDGKYDFETPVGKYTGDKGREGDLIVYLPKEGQIYAYGQKDYQNGADTLKAFARWTGEAFVECDRAGEPIPPHRRTRNEKPLEGEHAELPRTPLRDAINRERMSAEAVPAYDYPVKVSMFAHQIKGANMALMALGLMSPQEVLEGQNLHKAEALDEKNTDTVRNAVRMATKEAPELFEGEGAVCVTGSSDPENTIVSYGMVAFGFIGKIAEARCTASPNAVRLGSAAGDILGAAKGMLLAEEFGKKALTIYYAYDGVKNWCTGEWPPSAPLSEDYRKIYLRVSKNVDIRFVGLRKESLLRQAAGTLAQEALNGLKL